MTPPEVGAAIPRRILVKKELPTYIKLIYGCIYCLIAGDGSTEVTTEQLTETCRVNCYQASRVLRHLVYLKLIRFHRLPNDKALIRVIQNSNSD